MINKKAELIPFAVSFLAVLASFMVIFAPVRVTAPPADDTRCGKEGGHCFAGADCGAGEEKIGKFSPDNLGCGSNICCESITPCNDFGLFGLTIPCAAHSDCPAGLVCFSLASYTRGEFKDKCCTEKTVEICHKPGTPVQETMRVLIYSRPGHLAHGDLKGSCCGELTPCRRNGAITIPPGCVNVPGTQCLHESNSPGQGGAGPTCCRIPPEPSTTTTSSTTTTTEEPSTTTTEEPTTTTTEESTTTTTEVPTTTTTTESTTTTIPLPSPSPTPGS